MLGHGGVAFPLVAVGSWRALFFFKHHGIFFSDVLLFRVSGLNEEENQNGKVLLPPWDNVGCGLSGFRSLF